MLVEWPSAQVFSSCVDAIAALIDEAEFVFKPEGLFLKATDPSNVSMIDFKMPKKSFTKFEIGEPIKLGIDLDQLAQVSKRCKSGDKVLMTIDKQSNQLQFEFKGKSTRKFNIPLIDLVKPDLPELKISYDAEIQVSAEIIVDALKDAALVSNYVMISCDSKTFSIKAKSSKGSINNETATIDMVASDIKQACQSMFPSDYLNDMLKAASSKDVLTLKLGNDAPMMLSYKLGEVAEVNYFLAPRMESK